MRLHSAPRSGNSYKVRLLLGLLGMRCEVVDYDTKDGETHAQVFLESVNSDGTASTPAGRVEPFMPHSRTPSETYSGVSRRHPTRSGVAFP